MPRHYHSSAAKCPYYRGEEPTLIFCAGPCGSDTVRMSFRAGAPARIHKAKFCRGEWQGCPIAKMITTDKQERAE